MYIICENVLRVVVIIMPYNNVHNKDGIVCNVGTSTWCAGRPTRTTYQVVVVEWEYVDALLDFRNMSWMQS
jgi:hypothetical protein